MKKYIVSVDLEIDAESAEGGLEQAHLTIGNAVDALNQQLMHDDADYAETYDLDWHGASLDIDDADGITPQSAGVSVEELTGTGSVCARHHDHAQGWCGWRE